MEPNVECKKCGSTYDINYLLSQDESPVKCPNCESTWWMAPAYRLDVDPAEEYYASKTEVTPPEPPKERQVGGSHYKDMAIQPIEYTLANKLGFCEGNIIKYISRHKRKGGAEDIRKVIHYAEMILQEYEGGYYEE